MPSKPPAAPEQLRADLLELQPDFFASKWVIERIPYIFGDDSVAFWTWKHKLARLLDVDAASLLIVGSAAVGVSLSPNKNFRKFEAASDVDVAVVSNHHFDLVWRWLRALGAERYKWPVEVQRAIDEHRRRLVYWGIMATD